MGYMRHNAIIVTACIEGKIQLAHAKAVETFEIVSGVLEPPVNGYGTFLIPPDGSKEDWDESNDGDARREEFIGWLRSQAYSDGSSPYAWVEVQYGGDACETAVVSHSDDGVSLPATGT